MSTFKYISHALSIACLLLTLVSAAHDSGWVPTPGPGPTPIPDPDPPKPVESPFPADGFWLFVGSESEDMSGAEVVINAEVIRKEQGLAKMWQDYDRTGLEKPWQDALDWAEKKSGGKPYFVARHGNKAKEGTLTGSLDDQLKTLTDAMEALR